jgi:signal transduction histidine kinase
MHRLRQGASPSGADRANDLGSVRGGAERPKLVPYAGRFDGFHAVPASKTCLVRFDNNKYSVTASAVGRPVEVHAYADRIAIVAELITNTAKHGFKGERGMIVVEVRQADSDVQCRVADNGGSAENPVLSRRPASVD